MVTKKLRTSVNQHCLNACFILNSPDQIFVSAGNLGDGNPDYHRPKQIPSARSDHSRVTSWHIPPIFSLMPETSQAVLSQDRPYLQLNEGYLAIASPRFYCGGLF